MSHRKQRAEKNCLNCDAQVAGKYCQNCGQENVEPKENFGQFLKHFIEDLTHFDGKFFSTLYPLFLKPGFLTSEYVKGRRDTYFVPVRMYIFVSALFFLLMLSFFIRKNGKDNGEKMVAVGSTLKDLGQDIIKQDSIQERKEKPLVELNGRKIYYSDIKTVALYDSVQAALPEEERAGAIGSYFDRKALKSYEYKGEHSKEVEEKSMEKFFHYLPYVFFLSLPILALFLQVLYWRRKQFFYVGHVVFLIHVYCFIFLLLLLSMTIAQFGTVGSIGGSLLACSIPVYLFIAMLKHYRQNFFKTLLKVVLFASTGFITIVVLTLSMMVGAIFSFS